MSGTPAVSVCDENLVTIGWLSPGPRLHMQHPCTSCSYTLHIQLTVTTSVAFTVTVATSPHLELKAFSSRKDFATWCNDLAHCKSLSFLVECPSCGAGSLIRTFPWSRAAMKVIARPAHEPWRARGSCTTWLAPLGVQWLLSQWESRHTALEKQASLDIPLDGETEICPSFCEGYDHDSKGIERSWTLKFGVYAWAVTRFRNNRGVYSAETTVTWDLWVQKLFARITSPAVLEVWNDWLSVELMPQSRTVDLTGTRKRVSENEHVARDPHRRKISHMPTIESPLEEGQHAYCDWRLSKQLDEAYAPWKVDDATDSSGMARATLPLPERSVLGKRSRPYDDESYLTLQPAIPKKHKTAKQTVQRVSRDGSACGLGKRSRGYETDSDQSTRRSRKKHNASTLVLPMTTTQVQVPPTEHAPRLDKRTCDFEETGGPLKKRRGPPSNALQDVRYYTSDRFADDTNSGPYSSSMNYVDLLTGSIEDDVLKGAVDLTALANRSNNAYIQANHMDPFSMTCTSPPRSLFSLTDDNSEPVADSGLYEAFSDNEHNVQDWIDTPSGEVGPTAGDEDEYLNDGASVDSSEEDGDSDVESELYESEGLPDFQGRFT
ncbi:hypothetical protein LTR70_004871 [Exophiala xenobiotica]|uniref:Uncharacterized protein n=1 Tax=Lithohypha guttulata TaxID=1690604 RepID=A0ABR0KCX3_9EURO|nr:hypothetical protein LTR24_004489 [Lithohypha guttulata]KAK5319826.1 hypothetical protein LTR70_004871 [Exophiala xenobiotica]